MRFIKPQLGDDILIAVFASDGRILLNAVYVVRLGDADILAFERANHIGHLAAVAIAQTQERPARELHPLRLDSRQPVPLHRCIEGLRRNARADVEHQFVRYETRLALGRHSGEAALTGQWPIGEPEPRGEDFLPVRQDERAPLGWTLAEGGLAEPRLADRTFGKSGLAAGALAWVIAQSSAKRRLSGCDLAQAGPAESSLAEVVRMRDRIFVPDDRSLWRPLLAGVRVGGQPPLDWRE